MALIRTLISGVSVVGLAAAVAGTSLALSYINKTKLDLPSYAPIAQWKPKSGTVVLDAFGGLLGEHKREQREFVSIDEMPPLLWKAFVAAEDGNYWSHRGVDPVAIARAGVANLRSGGERVEGGSTITQQVVKNLVLSSERSIDRKVKEALLATQVDRDIGKKRILEIYLNEIYFGTGAYGVSAAAQVYFGRRLDELTIDQAATLAALPKAPSAVNPYSNPEKTVARRNYVLGRMAADGYITERLADNLKLRPLSAVPFGGSKTAEAIKPHMLYALESVRREIVGTGDIYNDGGEVRTFIHPALQFEAHKALRKHLVIEDRKAGGYHSPVMSSVPLPVGNWEHLNSNRPVGAEDWGVGVVSQVTRSAITLDTENGRFELSAERLGWATAGRTLSRVFHKGDAWLVGDVGSGPEIVHIPRMQGALVAMEPGTGRVLAMSGGFSYETSEFNRATQARRQIGSLFKPFIFLAATELGFDATSPVLDTPIALSQGPGLDAWRPQQGEDGMGLITLRRAAELSRNLATVRLYHDIGPDRVLDVAARAGLAMPKVSSDWSISLGSLAATPMNIASAYSSLANGGYAVVPTLVNSQGEAPVQLSQQFDPIAVAQVTSMLKGVATHGTARRAATGFQYASQLASKTGTTNDSKDAWFAAYNPNFVVVAWMGNDDGKPLPPKASGGGTAAPIVFDFLTKSAKSGAIEFGDFVQPHGAEYYPVDRATGEFSDAGDVEELIRD